MSDDKHTVGRVVFNPAPNAAVAAGPGDTFMAKATSGIDGAAVADYWFAIKRERDELKAERDALLLRLNTLEETRLIQLAAISTAAICNTPESDEKQRIGRDNPYWTVAYEDVRTAVAREMALLRRLDALTTLVREALSDCVENTVSWDSWMDQAEQLIGPAPSAPSEKPIKLGESFDLMNIHERDGLLYHGKSAPSEGEKPNVGPITSCGDQQYVCRACCEERRWPFNSIAQNRAGRKACYFCGDNSTDLDMYRVVEKSVQFGETK